MIELTAKDMREMTVEDKLNMILANQARLFWLISQAPGVARYADDVKHFGRIDHVFGGNDHKQTLGLVNGYLVDDGEEMLKEL